MSVDNLNVDHYSMLKPIMNNNSDTDTDTVIRDT